MGRLDTGVPRASQGRFNALPLAVCLLGASGVITSVTPPASACLPNVSTEVEVSPSSDTYPANAAVILQGYSLSEWELTATVDGEPVTLTVDEGLSDYPAGDWAYRILALRLEPEPLPGQTVTVSGNPCAYATCGDVAVSYVASEPDETPPEAPLEWWWSLRYYEPVPDEEADFVDTCGYLRRAATIAMQGTLANVPEDGDDPVFFSVSVTPETSSLSERGRSARGYDLYAVRDTALVGSLYLFTDQVEYPVTKNEYCVRVELLDRAGNTSGVEEKCIPCDISADVDGETLQCHPEGGICADGAPAESTDAECFAAATPTEGTTGGDASTEGNEPIDDDIADGPKSGRDAGVLPDDDVPVDDDIAKNRGADRGSSNRAVNTGSDAGRGCKVGPPLPAPAPWLFLALGAALIGIRRRRL